MPKGTREFESRLLRHFSKNYGSREKRPISALHKNTLIGKGLFIDVSGKSPASITAQGARIALRCIEKGMNPYELGVSLIGTRHLWPEVLDDIVELARKKHAESPNPRAPKNPSFPTQLVFSVFDKAGDMMGLTEEELKSIWIQSKTGPERNEPRLREFADSLINFSIRRMTPEERESYYDRRFSAVHTVRSAIINQHILGKR